MKNLFGVFGAVFGLLSVAAGAFGAHALRARLEPRMLEIWETAARYQMYHALALLAVAILAARAQSTSTQVAGWSFIAGTFIFSGSLYVLAISGVRWLGAITPIGGVAYLIGWAALAVTAARLG